MTPPLGRIRLVSACALLPVLALNACGDDDEGGGATDLNGRSFTATNVEGQTLADGSSLTIAFADDLMSVTGGCNTINGSFTVTDGVLEAPGLASTKMACEEPLMQQDTWVSALLTSGPTVELDGDELMLSDGSTTVTLTAG